MTGAVCALPGIFKPAVAGRTAKTVTAVGNAQVDTAQSKFGGASYLGDGSGDSLTITADTVFNFGTSDYTVECWIRSSSLAATRLIADLGQYTQNTRPVFYVTTDGKINIYTAATGAVSSAGSTITTNTWYHVALVRSSGTTTIYVDGVSRASTGTSYNMSSTATMYIGAETNGTTNSWNGHIDEFRISNIARYTTGFTAPTAPFVNDANTLLLLHMDGTDSITVFEDDVGVRAPKSVQANGNAQVDTAQSKFGGSSAYFDGTNDKLVVIGDFSQSGDFTFECWFRSNSIVGDRCLFAIGNESSGRQTIYTSGDDFRTDEYGAGGDDIWPASGGVTVDNWHHAALTRSGSTMTLWFNGVSKGTVTTTATIGNSNNIYIGALSDDAIDYIGHIDEFRVSNIARYTANFTPSTTPFQNDSNTLLLLHMDGTDASTTFTDDNS